MKKVSLSVLLLCLAAASNIAISGDKEINIVQSAPFVNEEVIASKIVDECVNLGGQLSAYTEQFLEKFGASVNLKPEVKETDEGMNLILEITNAFSAGNAWTGHRKSVSVKARLYENGELLETIDRTRDSGGGIGGGFKGSCDVLDRCAKALGSDIAKLLKKANRI